MTSTASGIGLRTLYNPENAIADIVFVHGLTGGRESTWIDKKTGTFWPADLLPKDIPNSRIFAFGYDADVVRVLDVASSNTVRNHGNSLAFDLALERVMTKTNDRPVIFVAHSLGGIVAEQALLICRGSAETYLKNLLNSSYAIAFMGTPHVGSDLAKWAHIFVNLSSILRKTNKEIIRVLEPGSEMLAALQQEFHTMLDARQKSEKKVIKIFCFYEELAVSGVGEIVPKHSAILSAYPSRSVHGNHMDMTKFSRRDDPGYKAVSGLLWLWVSEIESEILGMKEETLVPSKEEVRDLRVRRFGAMSDVDEMNFSGTVNSVGGPVIIGGQRAGRDVNIKS